MSLGAIERDGREVENAINNAKRNGTDKMGRPYYFIDLVLRDAGPLSGDPEHFAISGFKDLIPSQQYTDNNGAVRYEFSEEMGGYTRFRKTMDGSYEFSMWDDYDDFNKRFLASHLEKGYWDIKDPVLEDQVYQIYLEMKNNAAKETPLQKQLKELQDKYQNADPKDQSGIAKQMINIITKHEKDKRPVPKRDADLKKPRRKYRVEPTQKQLQLKAKPKKEREVVKAPSESVVKVDDE